MSSNGKYYKSTNTRNRLMENICQSIPQMLYKYCVENMNILFVLLKEFLCSKVRKLYVCFIRINKAKKLLF